MVRITSSASRRFCKVHSSPLTFRVTSCPLKPFSGWLYPTQRYSEARSKKKYPKHTAANIRLPSFDLPYSTVWPIHCSISGVTGFLLTLVPQRRLIPAIASGILGRWAVGSGSPIDRCTLLMAAIRIFTVPGAFCSLTGAMHHILQEEVLLLPVVVGDVPDRVNASPPAKELPPPVLRSVHRHCRLGVPVHQQRPTFLIPLSMTLYIGKPHHVPLWEETLRGLGSSQEVNRDMPLWLPPFTGFLVFAWAGRGPFSCYPQLASKEKALPLGLGDVAREYATTLYIGTTLSSTAGWRGPGVQQIRLPSPVLLRSLHFPLPRLPTRK